VAEIALLLSKVFQVLAFAIFARAIISWFPIDPQGPIVRTLNAITDPVLEPLRRVIPRIGMIDITPMVAIFVLFALSGALASASV
jgi:YggT family protein